VTKADKAERAVEAVLAAFRPIDVLVKALCDSIRKAVPALLVL
jgi:hypothetical protein